MLGRPAIPAWVRVVLEYHPSEPIQDFRESWSGDGFIETGGSATEEGHTTRTEESRSVTPNSATVARSVEGSELVDELGPIPSFPPLSLDPETGRMIPLSQAELEARRDAALRMLKVLHTITDEHDTDENWREACRNIDAPSGHRPFLRELSQ